MANKLNQMAVMASLLVFTACSSITIPNPFKSGAHEQLGAPQNACAYLCDGNKQFYVSMQNNGKDAWLIYPDHEVNLTQTSDKNRFTSGAISLVINGDATTLNDGEKIAYVGCKLQLKK